MNSFCRAVSSQALANTTARYRDQSTRSMSERYTMWKQTPLRYIADATSSSAGSLTGSAARCPVWKNTEVSPTSRTSAGDS